MADLIIQGLHLPKSLGGEETHIDIRIFSDGTVIMATSRQPYYKKFDAIPLPEGHGRLIDADAVCKDIVLYRDVETYEAERGNNTQHLERAYGANETLCIVCDAPTIIPAEGGG